MGWASEGEEGMGAGLFLRSTDMAAERVNGKTDKRHSEEWVQD